jgi:hypothetical protein
MAKTGSVTSKSGKVIVKGKIITGLDIEGAASDETLQAALEAMQHLQTGDVSGAEGVEAEEIVTGFRYFNPEAPTRESFVAELQALRQQLADLAAAPEIPAAVGHAVETLDEVVVETQKEQPLPRRIINRLRETISFISDAGKALDAASKAGPLILQAIVIATGLYQAAQVVF